MYKLKKGLSLPLQGAPIGDLFDIRNVKTVAVTGPDFYDMKPSMFVKEGDVVLKGQKLFECKKVPGVIFTAPAAGIVKSVNRGERRSFQSVVIEVDSEGKDISFEQFKVNGEYTRDELVELINEAGIWNSFRTRPYSKTPQLDSACNSIFVTAMDTNPLSIEASWVINQRQSEFKMGLEALSQLTDGSVNVCKQYGSNIPTVKNERVQNHEFDGPHPAGNVGTHIHFVDPINENKVVWHIGYQDLIALGSLILTGKLYTDRYISVCGPACSHPNLVLTSLGADIHEITANQKIDKNVRIVSGSIFNGRQVDESFHYLGKFSNQITLINECVEREFMGWHQPGHEKFSVMNLFASKLNPFAKFVFNTSTNGSKRAIVPIGAFEKVMPLDLLPSQLLKSLIIKDTDSAIELGALELDVEDLALCTFVCNGKNDYGVALRETLDIIEKEG